MLRRGEPPYLECSTKGDRRFSPFCAYVEGQSIEDAYHAHKILRPPLGGWEQQRSDDKRTGLTWREAKELQAAGWRLTNPKSCARLYRRLFEQYMRENKHLLPVIVAASGLSDMFGKETGNVCQVIELWRIRELHMAGKFLKRKQ